jgi:phage terminase large subunit
VSDWRETVERWRLSPFHFVIEAFFKLNENDWHPWRPGTPRPDRSPPGPEYWQGEFLKDVGKAIHEGKRKFSVRAGHGVGKSTVEAWLIIWFVLFHRGLKCPVTANSQDQLRDVVWAEIALWVRELPPFLRELIDVSAERVCIKSDPEGSFAVARTARPEKPEALQGFHARTLAFFVEEASGIPDIIFETASGALSSEDSWVFMFANPTRTSGYFHRSHHGSRGNWRTYHVPCHCSSRVSPNYARDIAAEYGEQSNVYRVRVLGEFPLSEDDAVIALGLVEASMEREVSPSESGIVWGLDVARFGDDATALCKRRGNMLLEPTREWRKLDLMQTCGVIAREYGEAPLELRPSSINVDVIGIGSGVVDRLRELGLPVRGINVGEQASTNPDRFMRLRDELWWKVRDWFESRAVYIPRDDALIAELVVPKYKLESSGKIKIESKDDMKKRGVKSPNRADALCLTFGGGDLVLINSRRSTAVQDYDPFNVGSDEFERYVTGRQTVAGEEYKPW